MKKPTREELVIFFSAYSTANKDKVSLDRWFEIKDRLRSSKEVAALMKRK